MTKQYKKEKFKDRNEALIWVADSKPIYDIDGDLDISTRSLGVIDAVTDWKHWHKAIEVVPEKRVIEFWVNVYPDRIGNGSYESKDDAIQCGGYLSIGTVKLSKEITIIDGKVCDE